MELSKKYLGSRVALAEWLYSLLLFCSIFLLSATNYLVFPVLFLSLLMLLAAGLTNVVTVRDLLLCLVFLTVYVIFLYVSWVHSITYPYSETYQLTEVSIKFFFNILFFLVVMLVLRSFKARAVIRSCLSGVILVHVFFLLFQGFNLYVYGVHYDFLEIVMGRAQRITGAAGVDGIYRLAGIYNEPGTYSVFMFLLVFCRYLVNRSIDAIFIIGFFSTLFTFSVQAFISVFIVCSFCFLINVYRVFLFFKVKPNNFLWVLGGVVVGGAFFVIFKDRFFSYLTARFLSGSTDGTVAIRYIDAFTAYSEIDPLTFFTGVGFDINAIQVLIADTGLLFSSVVQFGLFGLIGVLFLALCLRKDFMALVLFLLILISKLQLIYPALWFCFALITNFHLNERSPPLPGSKVA
ncbi:hypothetical protein ACQKC8_09075 [Stutzerimonas stutzeri]|uniref:hypothetical protein n=1 Tax=Stutzerimonas stutzeri TaxID=316 RepID=UPI003C2AAEF8